MDASSKTAAPRQMLRWWYGDSFRCGVADDWHCPCGRLVRPSDCEVIRGADTISVLWVCSGCFLELERIEIPLSGDLPEVD